MQRLHLRRSQVTVQLQCRLQDPHLIDDALFQLQHVLVVLRVVDDELGREERRLGHNINIFSRFNNIWISFFQKKIRYSSITSE